MSQSNDIADTVVSFCREHNLSRDAMIDLYARLRTDTDADWDDADPRIEASEIINAKCNFPSDPGYTPNAEAHGRRSRTVQPLVGNSGVLE